MWGIWYVSDNGDVFTFGESADGQLGLSAHQLANHSHPQRVESLHGVLQVACGGKHTLALTGDGNIHNSVLQTFGHFNCINFNPLNTFYYPLDNKISNQVAFKTEIKTLICCYLMQ